MEQRKELRDIVFSVWPACTEADPEHPDEPFRVSFGAHAMCLQQQMKLAKGQQLACSRVKCTLLAEYAGQSPERLQMPLPDQPQLANLVWLQHGNTNKTCRCPTGP